jgi:hypothetical protein
VVTAKLPAWLCACSACTAAPVCWQRCGGCVTTGMECRSDVYCSVLIAQGAQSLLVVHIGQLNVGAILRLFGDCATPAMRAAAAVANCSSTLCWAQFSTQVPSAGDFEQ